LELPAHVLDSLCCAVSEPKRLEGGCGEKSEPTFGLYDACET